MTQAAYNQLLENSKIASPQSVPLIPLQMSVLCRIVHLHRGPINSIRPILVEPFGFLTTSEDKKVKIIDMVGRVKCSLNLLETNSQLPSTWNFGYDFVRAKKEELEKVARLVTIIKNR